MKTNLLSLIFLVALSACSQSEEELAAQRRQERIQQEEQQAEKEKRDKEFQRQTEEETERQRQKAEQMAIEAAKPKEPEYEDVTFYYVTIKDRNVKCKTAEFQGNCGVSFNECDNGKIYTCMVNVEYFTKDEKVLVEQEQ